MPTAGFSTFCLIMAYDAVFLLFHPLDILLPTFTRCYSFSRLFGGRIVLFLLTYFSANTILAIVLCLSLFSAVLAFLLALLYFLSNLYTPAISFVLFLLISLILSVVSSLCFSIKLYFSTLSYFLYYWAHSEFRSDREGSSGVVGITI